MQRSKTALQETVDTRGGGQYVDNNTEKHRIFNFHTYRLKHSDHCSDCFDRVGFLIAFLG